jgi:hypothetical protein
VSALPCYTFCLDELIARLSTNYVHPVFGDMGKILWCSGGGGRGGEWDERSAAYGYGRQTPCSTFSCC